MLFDDSGDQADTRIEQVLNALEIKDSKCLEELFSKQALSEIDNFDEQTRDLFDLFQGTVDSWEQTGFTSTEDIEGHKKMTKGISWYDVTTDENEFVFFMIDCFTDTQNPDNIGLYTLYVVNKDDEDSKLTCWENMEIAGVYTP